VESGCIAVDDLAHAEPEGARAVVEWQDDFHVRVRVAGAGSDAWVEREMTFEAKDAREQRWTAAGLIIGTLATVANQPADAVEQSEPDRKPAPDALPTAEPAPKPAPREPAKSPPPAPDPNAASPPPGVWMTVAAITGPALDRRPWRMGGEFSLHGPIASGPVFLLIGASYAQTLGTFDTLRGDWTTVFGGAGYHFVWTTRVTADVRAEGLAQRFALTADQPPLDAAPLSGRRWLGGVRAGLHCTWWPTETIGIGGGMAGRWVASSTEVTVNRERVATERPLTATFRLGASVRF
jgi:hypothetical protein